jgi:hypothetical protein
MKLSKITKALAHDKDILGKIGTPSILNAITQLYRCYNLLCGLSVGTNMYFHTPINS